MWCRCGLGRNGVGEVSWDEQVGRGDCDEGGGWGIGYSAEL